MQARRCNKVALTIVANLFPFGCDLRMHLCICCPLQNCWQRNWHPLGVTKKVLGGRETLLTLASSSTFVKTTFLLSDDMGPQEPR
jgi:hypothetical protein